MTSTKENFVISGSPTNFTASVGPGVIVQSGGTVYEFSGGTVSLTASATNFIYLTLATGTLSATTTAATSNGMLIGVVVTGSVGVTSIKQGFADEDSDPLQQVATLGVGGANDGTQAPLYIENNSLDLAESASLTSSRLIELAASVSSTQHKVLDAGFHIDCNGFNFTGDLTATYGGWFAENSTGSGTVTDARGVGAFGQVGAGGIVTHGYGLRSTLSTAATGTLTNGYGIWTGCTNSGTLTNWYGVTVGNVTAGTITVGFRSQIAAGTGKWGLYLDGGANNYLGTGYTILGTTTAPSTGILQLATATNAAGGISFGSDVTLYRSAANVLSTDDSLTIGGDLTIPSSSQILFTSRGRYGASTDGEHTTFNAAATTNASVRMRQFSPAAKTASFNVSATESGATFNNAGATARVDATLPASPGAGAKYRFVVADADGIRIQTGTAVQIRYAASITTATTGYIQSTTIGDVLEVELVGGTWFVVDVIGAGWSVV